MAIHWIWLIAHLKYHVPIYVICRHLRFVRCPKTLCSKLSSSWHVNMRGLFIRNISEMCISIRLQAENHTVAVNEFIFIEYIFYFLWMKYRRYLKTGWLDRLLPQFWMNFEPTFCNFLKMGRGCYTPLMCAPGKYF